MGNEKLRKQMLWFSGFFVVVFIVGLYVRNVSLQKTGPRTDFLPTPDNYKIETYDNGKVRAKGALINGYIKDGVWTYYREDGTVEGTELYKDGKLVEVKDSVK